MIEVRCKTCDRGVLSLQKVHRMSGPAVTIGYILLIPSLLGILGSIGFFILTMAGAASAVPTDLRPETVERLRDAGVPTDVIATLRNNMPVGLEQKQRLDSTQLRAVEEAESEMNISTGAAGCFGACGTTVAATMALLALAGGLLGWLLVMKKRVLVCSACPAVAPAS